jgi:ribosomal protein S12 methylthiotransferase accessory factor YcaO
MDGKADKLRNAGLIADQPLPDHYYRMIEDLSDDEIDSLIALRERLERAGFPVAPLTAPRAGGEQCIVVL